MKLFKRLLSMILTVFMLVYSIPLSILTAFADEYFNSTMNGSVTTSDGIGIPHVCVWVYDISDRDVIDYYFTDDNGCWSTGKECVCGNRYLVSYYHRDYSFSENTVVIEATKETNTIDPVTAEKNGVEYTDSDASLFDYEILNGTEIEITQYHGTEDTVVIPSEIDGYSVTAISNGVFQEKTSLKIVVLPESVERLGQDCFYGCTNLSKVMFSAGLTTIGNCAFQNCQSLKSIELPNTLTKIGDSAFEYCNFSEVLLPDSITSIGEYAFGSDEYTKSNLTSINFPMAWTNAGGNLFSDCNQLTEITIPEGVVRIPDYAFENAVNERIENAKVTAYWIPSDNSDTFFDSVPSDDTYGTIWDAADWDQANSLTTDANGCYAWNVPEGWWRVKCEKIGYDTVWSEWLPVPPPQTNVNIAMTKKVDILPDCSKCDVNSDGKVSVADAVLVCRAMSEDPLLENDLTVDERMHIFDFTQDYIVDIRDVLYILQELQKSVKQ